MIYILSTLLLLLCATNLYAISQIERLKYENNRLKIAVSLERSLHEMTECGYPEH